MTVMKRILPLLLICFSWYSSAQNLNGEIDDLNELTTVYNEKFVMPDGIELSTDIYLPIMQDCLMVPISIEMPEIIQGIFGSDPIEYNLELIPRNTQYLIYDSLWVNGVGQKNPNPYQLPMVLTRTPYDKGDQDAEEAPVMSLLGYVFAKQDQRGRYDSEGVYFPLTSDAYNKNPYHPTWQHILDRTDLDEPANGNRHEDGYHTIEYIKNSLMRDYDFDGDGITDTTDLLYNGRIGMFGASALGYNQYQAAAAHRIDPDEPGLKCLLPIVAPGDFYKGVGFPNGVMRDRLVTGWLKGQIFDTEDDLIPIDDDVQNNMHSSADYDLPKTIDVNGVPWTYQPNKFDAANLAIDHFLSVRYDGEPCGYYPNSPARAELDISRAPVDSNGESVMKGKVDPSSGKVIDVPDSDPDGLIGFGNTGRPNLDHNRYTNMDVPAYHLVGWWDIFVDSQTETWANMRRYVPKGHDNNRLQKLVIGPWAHQTIGQQTTGDRTYPDNVNDLMGLDFDDFDSDNIPISEAVNSEIIGWFRYNLNYTPDHYIGEPKFVLPRAESLIEIADLGIVGTLSLRIPSEELRVPFDDLLGMFNGSQDLENVKAEIVYDTPLGDGEIPVTLPSIPIGEVIPGLGSGDITPIPFRDFTDENIAPNVRVYMVGPNNDSESQNVDLGNYWLRLDTFPLHENREWDAVQREIFYMHKDGSLNQTAPSSDEGYKMYVHDPDDPIRTVGGANMIVHTPDGERDSQGQFELTNPLYVHTTMDRPGVIQFESNPVQDSLCILGYPTVKLYAKSSIGGLSGGPTDTDFHVRIVDVYPDGREYFVQDGCVNARARDYARMLVEEKWKDQAHHHPGDDIPFTNIEIGELYEYVFEMLPIGYVFGDGHKIKILISSSNYTRFQVNPNLPINEGEFFRRKPGDGKMYKYDGQWMAPRVAIQRIHFSPDHPSQIQLPIFSGPYHMNVEDRPEANDDLLIFPNPAKDQLSVFTSTGHSSAITVYDLSGKQMYTGRSFKDQIDIDVAEFSSGFYVIRVLDEETGKVQTGKFVKE